MSVCNCWLGGGGGGNSHSIPPGCVPFLTSHETSLNMESMQRMFTAFHGSKLFPSCPKHFVFTCNNF